MQRFQPIYNSLGVNSVQPSTTSACISALIHDLEIPGPDTSTPTLLNNYIKVSRNGSEVGKKTGSARG